MDCRKPLIAMLLLGGTACSAIVPRVVEPWRGNAPVARDAALLRAVMLAEHNRARAGEGVAPLAWDDELAADAARYAEVLARERKFEHSKEPRGRIAQGENLWTGTRGAYGYAEMIGHWVAEKKLWRRDAKVPDLSTTGRFGDVGHYTQIIWRGSTAVGCAFASNASDDYLVCRYAPPGNVFGRGPLE